MIENNFKSRMYYTVTNSNQRTYAFTFTYLKKSFIAVKTYGGTEGSEVIYTYGIDFTVSDLSIIFNESIILPLGSTLLISRETSSTNIITWADASILLASDMSIDQMQVLHIVEESEDYIQVELNATTGAEVAASASAESARLASISETNAEDAAARALVSANNAKSSETNVGEMEYHVEALVSNITMTVAPVAGYATSASASAVSASNSASNATVAASTATAQALLAKDYAEQAAESAGGDFVTKTYAADTFITSITELNGTITVKRGNGNSDSFTPFSLDSCYPVGAIYVSTMATSPNTLFGGAWEALEQGRVLLSQGADYEGGSTGGEATHVISIDEIPSHSHSGSTTSNGEHNHTGTTSWANLQGWGDTFMRKMDTAQPNPSTSGVISASMGSNSPYKVGFISLDGMGQQVRYNLNVSHSHSFTTTSNGEHSHTISNAGGGLAHNNMQPYLVVYMWKRVS